MYIYIYYFVNQPLHVSGIFVAHHQEVYCIYTIDTCCAEKQLVHIKASLGLVHKNMYRNVILHASCSWDSGIRTLLQSLW